MFVVKIPMESSDDIILINRANAESYITHIFSHPHYDSKVIIKKHITDVVPVANGSKVLKLVALPKSNTYNNLFIATKSNPATLQPSRIKQIPELANVHFMFLWMTETIAGLMVMVVSITL